MLITKIFLGILAFMIYIYAGLRVSEDIENNYYLIYPVSPNNKITKHKTQKHITKHNNQSFIIYKLYLLYSF